MVRHVPVVTTEQALEVARLWDPRAARVVHVRDGENSTWSFVGEGHRVLRLTSEAHRTRELLEGELAFVEHVVAGGVNAARPLGSLEGEKVVEVSQTVGSEERTYATVFERLEGRHFEYYSDDIDRALFNEWGRLLGLLHSLSETFTPPHGSGAHTGQKTKWPAAALTVCRSKTGC